MLFIITSRQQHNWMLLWANQNRGYFSFKAMPCLLPILISLTQSKLKNYLFSTSEPWVLPFITVI